jgi:hypothetical protein
MLSLQHRKRQEPALSAVEGMGQSQFQNGKAELLYLAVAATTAAAIASLWFLPQGGPMEVLN